VTPPEIIAVAQTESETIGTSSSRSLSARVPPSVVTPQPYTQPFWPVKSAPEVGRQAGDQALRSTDWVSFSRAMSLTLVSWL